MEIKIGSSFQPLEGTSKATNPLCTTSSSQSRSTVAASAGLPKPSCLPPLPKDVAVEKYTGLRIRLGRKLDTLENSKSAVEFKSQTHKQIQGFNFNLVF